MKTEEQFNEIYEMALKLKTYIDTYGSCGGMCMGCGELKHVSYRCIHCGCDDSDVESFQYWIESELARAHITNYERNIDELV